MVFNSCQVKNYSLLFMRNYSIKKKFYCTQFYVMFSIIFFFYPTETAVNGTSEEDDLSKAEETPDTIKEDLTSLNPDKADKTEKNVTSDSVTENNFQENKAQESPSKTTEKSTKSPTVQRIIDLLNEMEATSQMEHCGLQKFHPCPLCSGKLITV